MSHRPEGLTGAQAGWDPRRGGGAADSWLWSPCQLFSGNISEVNVLIEVPGVQDTQRILLECSSLIVNFLPTCVCLLQGAVIT